MVQPVADVGHDNMTPLPWVDPYLAISLCVIVMQLVADVPPSSINA